MKIFICLLLGYLLGSLSPSALLSRLKKTNLREHGTGNLGATNTMINFGKRYGAIVMLFDIFKSWAAFQLAAMLFPGVALAGLLAAISAVVGHIFPFYLGFKGGKGLAAFGGLILAYDLRIFGILLVISLAAMLIVNYSCAMPVSAAVLLPFFAYAHSRDVLMLVLMIALCGLIIWGHRVNIGRALRGEESKIRDYIRNQLFH